MTKARLNQIEFYITNVCNYNCQDCNRLNNYHFSGHQYWNDYKEIYKQWSCKLDFNKITVLGGEPLLNPSLVDWLEGIREYWPDAKIELLTNGSRLEYWKDLYNILKDNRIDMSVQLHNRDRYQNYITYLQSNFFGNSDLTYDYSNQDLEGWIDAYNSIKEPHWPNIESYKDFDKLPDFIKQECTEIHKIDPDTFKKNTNGVKISDNNGISVSVQYSEDFWTGPLLYSGNNKFDVYNSNPTKAHEVCKSKFCHHFIKGKLYKCHHVALLPEFMEQFYVNLNDKDSNLLNSYQPLTNTQSTDDIIKFIGSLTDEIPQCKFCPEVLSSKIIKSDTHKIKIVKKSKIHNNSLL